MNSKDEMINTNRKQAEFYDAIHLAEANVGHGGYAENKKANLITRFWADLRYRQQAAVKQAGVEMMVKEAHQRWARTRENGSVLEVGCFSGSRFTQHLATIGASYLGVELSGKAVDALNAKFLASGLAHKARAQAVDILAFNSAEQFDLIYAHGVLHHFRDPAPLFEKLNSLAKPNAILIFAEPAMINPIYRLVRALYRPFQSDSEWEWPFTRKTVSELERHFTAVEGFGWGRTSLPLSVIAGLPLIGRAVYPIYLRAIRSEIAAGWNSQVWRNSYVTAVYQKRQ